jgi:ACT domain-containing protein
MQPSSSRVVVTVIGHDKVGIIAGVASLLAEAGVNIIDISQTTMREFFTMIMLVDLEKATVAFDEVKRRLQQKGEQMGLKIDAQREDVFQYMHRI